LTLPVVVLLPAQGAVSGYLLFKLLSMSSLFCCAVMAGLDAPLATVSDPVEFGLTTTIVSLSWLAMVQPAGRGTVAPRFVTEVAPFVDDVGDAIGLGVVAGVGLGKPAIPPLGVKPPPPPSSAIAVPQPAITTTRPTIALMIKTHGVRCTAAGGAAAAGA
jgi:hypothetical protein